MILTDGGNKLNLDELKAFEREMNIILPSEYIEFMIDTNGGMPEEDFVFDYFDLVTEGEKRSLIQDFFVIYLDDNYEVNNLKNICNQLWNDHAISRKMFPFAEDPAGNYICISLDKENYGTVLFCDHEYEDSETEYMMSSKISDSFSDFVNSLYIDET